MRAKELMSPEVRVARPEDTIEKAAKMMAEMEVGALPVAQDDRLVGMITDRDIAVRAVAENRPPSTKVREVMTIDMKFCYDDEDIEDVSRHMSKEQVRRLPVVNRDNRLVGILALGDLANQGAAGPASQALEGISRPGGRHTQSPS